MAQRRSMIRRDGMAPVLALVVAALAGGGAKAQIEAPPLEPNLGWLNTDRPLRLGEELKGHVVLLDFWTYCCINCMHVLPDLEYLEEKYEDEPFVVIGVHSAKFTNESTRESIRQAIERYDIRHPVVIDRGFGIWRAYGARAWPTFVLIGADGVAIGQASGEGVRDLLDRQIASALAAAQRDGTLASSKVRFEPGESVSSVSGLRFPGKVEAAAPTDARPGRLFIADSSNDRVVVATWPDDMGRSEVIDVYGGRRGFRDGDVDAALLHDPQGMVHHAAENALYVADTNNHAIRRIDLEAGTVETIAGNGLLSRDREGGAAGRNQGLNSPWDVELSEDGGTLYVAMAGPHQLWSVDLESGVARRLAGSGREALLDGPAATCALAQPSGLALGDDGDTLYFADSEVSAVRVLDLEAERVSTIIGEGLFEFGDVDGPLDEARLQHVLGVATLQDEHGEALLIADTYNHKIKRIDLERDTVKTWLPAPGDDLTLDEPGGLTLVEDEDRLFIADTNHHRIVMVDVEARRWREIAVEGLLDRDAFSAEATPAQAAVETGAPLVLRVDGGMAAGRKINPEAPLSVRIVEGRGGGRTVVAQRTVRVRRFPVEIEIPAEFVQADASFQIDAAWASCDDDQVECRPEEASWRLTLKDGEARLVTLVAAEESSEEAP